MGSGTVSSAIEYGLPFPFYYYKILYYDTEQDILYVCALHASSLCHCTVLNCLSARQLEIVTVLVCFDKIFKNVEVLIQRGSTIPPIVRWWSKRGSGQAIKH